MTNEYRSLKDHVYNHIVDLIDGGTLADDHKISEQQICDALGVSRTPVREALIQLAADGYLENVPRKGFYVKRVTEDSAREIVEIIGPLDGRAALLAVGDMTDDDIAQLQFLHGSMQLAIEKGLYKKYDDLQHDFHDCYVRKCGNTRLIGLIHQMNRYFMKREYANVGADELDGLLRKANEEHAEIVRLFELRDGVVRVGHTSGEILVTLVTNGRAFPASRAFCRELVRRCPRITSVVQNVNERQTNVILGEREQTLYGPGFILDKLCGLSFRISSQSFYQVNAVQTEVLYERAIDLAGFTGSETAIDAYCGTGTIGLVAAKRGARQVIGVDTVASAVRDARENAKHNGVENARFAVGDAGAFMRERAAAGDAVDVLLMDPPRAGSSEEFLAAAATLAPRRIVYISCNPTTQVRDLAFLRQHGYAVRTVQPVDMFPHTDHIETIALVERVAGFFERSDR